MLKLTRAVAVLLVFALAAAAQSPAQNWNNVKALAVGTPVRVSLGSRTVSGQVQGVTDDAIAVNSGKGQEMFTRQEVTRASVKEKGHRGRNTLIGVAVGAGIGGGIGAGAGGGFVPKGEVAGGLAAALGLVGGIIGAVIPTGGWREVYRQ